MVETIVYLNERFKTAPYVYFQTNEEVSRSVSAIKVSICGDNTTDPTPDVIAQVANEVYSLDLLSLMIVHLGKFDFEVSCRGAIVI